MDKRLCRGRCEVTWCEEQEKCARWLASFLGSPWPRRNLGMGILPPPYDEQRQGTVALASPRVPVRRVGKSEERDAARTVMPWTTLMWKAMFDTTSRFATLGTLVLGSAHRLHQRWPPPSPLSSPAERRKAQQQHFLHMP